MIIVVLKKRNVKKIPRALTEFQRKFLRAHRLLDPNNISLSFHVQITQSQFPAYLFTQIHPTLAQNKNRNETVNVNKRYIENVVQSLPNKRDTCRCIQIIK